MKHQIQTAVDNGLEYLATYQYENMGTRASLSSIRSISLALLGLAQISTPACMKIRQNLADTLSSYNTFYDLDLNTTFLVYTALKSHDSARITPQMLANITNLLLKAELAIGGPYKNISNKEPISASSVDLATNALIANFLSLIPVTLPNLTKLFERAITQKDFTSSSDSSYFTMYLIARVYNGTYSSQLAEQLGELKPFSPLDIALTSSSLLYLDAPRENISSYIQSLLKMQESDGSWHQSDILHTVFCIKTLVLYLHKFHTKSTTKTRKRSIKSLSLTPELYAHITLQITRDTQEITQPLQSIFREFCYKLLDSNSGAEITALPQAFNYSLKQPLIKSHRFLADIGAFNLYSWVAYTIYDDFLDDEGDPLLLSAANIAMRRAYESFLQIKPDNAHFNKVIQQIFDAIDGANTWEITCCRFDATNNSITITDLPDFKNLSQLADRSLAHALCLLTILAKKDIDTYSKDFQAIYTAFKHYLIARQLNDDIHDWQDDLRKGHITYVVKVIMAQLMLPKGVYRFTALLPVMQKQFWAYSLDTIYNEMQYHISVARAELRNSLLLQPTNIVESLLQNIELSIEDSRRKQAENEEFLTHF